LRLEHLTPAFSTPHGAMYHRDAIALLTALPDDSVDLIMTSPPFALTRQKPYGNVPAERYCDWFLPFAHEIRRVLRPGGTFLLDLGGAWTPGATGRSLYHFVVGLRLVDEVGLFLAQEFFWHNPARLPAPAEWVTVRRVRVKDAVNTVWWFGKTAHPKADNRKV